MIIAPTRRRRRSTHAPPWPLRPNALWIGATLLFLGALAWMLLIELPCGRGACGGLEVSNQWTVFWRIWLALSVLALAYLSRYWRWLRARRKIS
ncbi:hypothetical protein [Lysobacter sp. CA199]|uniref:hypothetical protein n=1 Tax=Lysobacter sp. CA199 TaxID=3455608 RepID=UPI003F8D822A